MWGDLERSAGKCWDVGIKGIVPCKRLVNTLVQPCLIGTLFSYSVPFSLSSWARDSLFTCVYGTVSTSNYNQTTSQRREPTCLWCQHLKTRVRIKSLEWDYKSEVHVSMVPPHRFKSRCESEYLIHSEDQARLASK